MLDADTGWHGSGMECDDGVDLTAVAYYCPVAKTSFVFCNCTCPHLMIVISLSRLWPSWSTLVTELGPWSRLLGICDWGEEYVCFSWILMNFSTHNGRIKWCSVCWESVNSVRERDLATALFCLESSGILPMKMKVLHLRWSEDKGYSLPAWRKC